MENTGFKGLLVTLWQRVFLSYKSTLVGIGCVAAGYVVQYLVDVLSGSQNKIAATAGVLIGTVFALVKDKLPAPPPRLES